MLHDSPFDSQIYGCKIGRLAIGHPAELQPGLEEARANGFAVVFLRIDDTATELASAIGIAPLETLVTSTLGNAPLPAMRTEMAVEHHETIRDARDVARIGELTAEAITISHLHADPRLPRERTRALYAAWARNDATGRAQRTLVARGGDEILGYITVLVADRSAVIDLVAVSANAQGHGIGSALLREFVGWARAEGLAARVGTQSDNPALGLYQRFGFIPTQRQVTYHLWLDSWPW